MIYVHIDKKKKFPATALLRAFGYGTNADILRLFFATKDAEHHRQARRPAGAARGHRRRCSPQDVPNPEDPRGEPLGEVGDELTQERLNEMRHKGVKTVTVFAGYTTLDLRDEEQPDHHARPAEPRPGVRRGRPRDRRSRRRGAARSSPRRCGRSCSRPECIKVEVLLPGRAVGVAADQEHAGQGPDPQRGRGPRADLRPAPARRRAEPGDRTAAAPEAVLQPEAVRPGPGGPLQDQPAAQAARPTRTTRS